MDERERIEQVATDISRYTRDRTTGCWMWNGATFSSGHGAVKIMGIAHIAHRVIFSYFRGQIPIGLHLHHTCERPACVNPAHLMLVTPGEHSRIHAKLSYAKVAEIRRLANEEGWPQQRIAEMFGVGQTTVSRAIRGSTWPPQLARRRAA